MFREKPSLARHVAASVLAPIQLHESLLDLVLAVIGAQRVYPDVRELPIIVETRAVFPAMQLSSSNSFARKKAHNLKRRPLKRAARVDQNAVHVKDDERRSR